MVERIDYVAFIKDVIRLWRKGVIPREKIRENLQEGLASDDQQTDRREHGLDVSVSRVNTGSAKVERT